ncbi:ATPase [Paenibacillus glycanilyticus]|uniref:N-acetylglucosamine kinase n=1 Tax=Paenibacillus glycanilyticus TaxID=126569 RepID=UPI00203DD62A|nr:BadF/BadG/BcrA/BcrD ATPase family protein [Paenibacillus glycanilyticus]MCM3630885.1 ATPase [Paenibacillus glycanilyticus]
MAYIMGVDGGNSKTFTVITDEEGRLLGRGLAGCGNHQGPGIEEAIANISKSADIALEQAGLKYEDIAFVQYGLAGADREKDFQLLRPALARLPFPKWDVVCDTFEGLRTGTHDNIGVVLVCGSGTNAAGRNREGQTVQTGGFGYLFGDRTGGGDMAKETFSHAVRSWDLREVPSVLPSKVAKYFGYSNMGRVYDHFLDNDINQVPRDLTLVLHEAGDEGDELAVRLLRRAGDELGRSANSVIRRLGGFPGETIRIVMVGSVVQEGRNPHLLAALREKIAEQNERFEFIIPKMAPVYGSLLLAMDRLGLPVSEAIVQRFEEYGGYQS